MRRLALILALALFVAPVAAEAPGAPRDGHLAIVDTHAHPLRSLHRSTVAISTPGLLQLMDELVSSRWYSYHHRFQGGHPGIYGRREIEDMLRGGAGGRPWSPAASP